MTLTKDDPQLEGFNTGRFQYWMRLDGFGKAPMMNRSRKRNLDFVPISRAESKVFGKLKEREEGKTGRGRNKRRQDRSCFDKPIRLKEDVSNYQIHSGEKKNDG